jgi:SAM-dependent methyltransferase
MISDVQTKRVHTQRHRAESFGSVAEQYDRFRPSYPSALIDDLAALDPADVLDVGCGTGKAGRLLAERGLPVLGVEIDGEMAKVARRHGLAVEIAPFESWGAGGRRFDLIICGQAWHWVDPVLGVAKAASLLRHGGTVAVFWNTRQVDDHLQGELDRAYRRCAPELVRESVNPGASAQPYAEDLEGSGLFEPATQRVYSWQKAYTGANWVQLMQTHSDLVTFDGELRAALVKEVAAVIDAHGGTLMADYRTYAVFAKVRGG